jgi:hypothetical protein
MYREEYFSSCKAPNYIFQDSHRVAEEVQTS